MFRKFSQKGRASKKFPAMPRSYTEWLYPVFLMDFSQNSIVLIAFDISQMWKPKNAVASGGRGEQARTNQIQASFPDSTQRHKKLSAHIDGTCS